MKNLLLAAILLSTIACNGSGGGPLTVDPETNQIIQEVEHYSVLDEDGFGFEIPCEEVDTETLLKTCIPVNTTTDLRALEDYDVIPYDGGYVKVDHEGEGVKFAYDSMYSFTLFEGGGIDGEDTLTHLESNHYLWKVENEELIITRVHINNTNGSRVQHTIVKRFNIVR